MQKAFIVAAAVVVVVAVVDVALHCFQCMQEKNTFLLERTDSASDNAH